MKFFALGGLNEIGKHLYILEIDNKLLILDMGIKIPNKYNVGVDLIVPNMKYLQQNKNRIIGIVISHGHQENCGAIPYIIDKIPNVKIYANELAIGAIFKAINFSKRWKLKKQKLNFIKLRINTEYKLSDNLSIIPYEVLHSYPETFNFFIKSNEGNILYSTDYICSFNKIWDKNISSYFNYLSRQKIKLLLSDSSNLFHKGYTSPNYSIKDVFDKIIQTNPNKKYIVSCYEQDILYIKEIIDVAYKYRLPIAIENKNMISFLERISKNGYLDSKKLKLISVEKFSNEDKGILILSGMIGSLYKSIQDIFEGKNNIINLDSNKNIFVPLTRIIPGNELTVVDAMNEIVKSGIEIKYINFKEIMSMEPSQDDLSMLLSITNPEYFIPIKGMYRELLTAKRIASQFIKKENIYVLDNGKILEINNNETSLSNIKENVGDVYIDGTGIGDVSDSVIEERRILGNEGVISITGLIDNNTFELKSELKITHRGIGDKISGKMLDSFKEIIREKLKENNNNTDNNDKYDIEIVKRKLKNKLTRMVQKKINKKPIILLILIKI